MLANASTELKNICTDHVNFKHNTVNRRKHVLKSKENVLKSKCRKILKRKLKKYKLRADGKEDQDVLDISQSFLAKLRIKSPNSHKAYSILSNSSCVITQVNPKNYLFNMARRKINKTKCAEVSSVTTQDNNETGTCGNANISSLGILSTDENWIHSSQEKIQTNAFKLMMESRNKSIGSNSPGKEKTSDTSDLEVMERRNIKAKRHLMLKQMAEAKGSLKKKELEEYQEKCIKHKMEKRAKRLKNLITKNGSKLEKNGKKVDCSTSIIESSPVLCDKLKNSYKTKETSSQSLQIIDIFEDMVESSDRKNNHLLHENSDDDFLKKLSPSIRKKESMLCYIKKVERNSDSTLALIEDPKFDDDSHIIKVKFTSKKKLQKASKNNKDDISKVANSISSNKVSSKNSKSSEGGGPCINNEKKRKKQKYAEKLNNDISNNKVKNIVHDAVEETDKTRPKRCKRRPVKYIDDEEQSSSDEEFHIFTPIKKKRLETQLHNKGMNNHRAENIKTDELTGIRNINMGKSSVKEIASQQQKKVTKLAPIFTAKSCDSSSKEAKRRFLQSGVPDKIKKITAQQSNRNVEMNNFPTVVHIQQNEKNTVKNDTIDTHLAFPSDELDEEIKVKDIYTFKKLLSLTKACAETMTQSESMNSDTNMLLQTIKKTYPKFPVSRTYRLLKEKTKAKHKVCKYNDLDNSAEIMNDVDNEYENPDILNWTDKYKAMSASQIIGNFENIKELRRWMISWTENEIRSKNNTVEGSDSDYYQSDVDSRDCTKPVNNVAIVSGPIGCGKTLSVYAVAAELAIKVIEVNASSKRTGKIMLQDLQEATQSHKVNRTMGNSSAENSQNSQEIPDPVSKKGKLKGKVKHITMKKNNSSVIPLDNNERQTEQLINQDNIRTGMSLILIDDADIVFDQDDGFYSAVSQLIQFSKRPVILVTSSLTCPQLQRFLQYGKIINMNSLLPKMLGTWLDIMCIADNGKCWPGMSAKFLEFFKGDIRKTINCLQFYMSSHVQDTEVSYDTLSQNSNICKPDLEDENSSTSWVNNEIVEESNINSDNMITFENSPWKCFIDKQSNLLHFSYPLELFNIWWCLPNLLDGMYKFSDNEINYNLNNKISVERLTTIANTIDNISVSDCISCISPKITTNITSNPWHSPEFDSVLELENLYYYNKNYEMCDEISHYLMANSITETQKTFRCRRNVFIQPPDIVLQRERDRIVSRHNNLSKYFNPAAVLNRNALSLDYWSYCRTICRTEKTKVDNNTKRNNRFCHYLKTLKVMFKNDAFDSLSDSLLPECKKTVQN